MNSAVLRVLMKRLLVVHIGMEQGMECDIANMDKQCFRPVWLGALITACYDSNSLSGTTAVLINGIGNVHTSKRLSKESVH